MTPQIFAESSSFYEPRRQALKTDIKPKISKNLLSAKYTPYSGAFFLLIVFLNATFNKNLIAKNEALINLLVYLMQKF